MAPIDEFHARIARTALRAAARHGFALGGGLALIAHGIVDRPTEDVDLFSDVDGSVPAAAELVRRALAAAGIDVVRTESDLGIDGVDEQVAELTAYRGDGAGVRLSLGHLSRTRRPVVLDIGPVMHPDDLSAWKVAALVSRAEARDLIDVAAFLAGHSVRQLLDRGRHVDPAITDAEIAAVARRLDTMPDRELMRYGLDAAAVSRLRQRFAGWPR